MPLITPDLSAQYEGYSPDEQQDEALNGATESPAAQKPVATSQSGPEDDQIAALRKHYGIGAPQDGGHVANAKGTARPSQWKQAGQPRAPEDHDLGIGETLAGAASNLVPSTIEAGKAAYQAVRHPLDTAHAIGQVGEGAFSQITDALGMNSDDPATKRKKQAAIQVLEDHYKNTYGSVQGFAHAFAKDPFGIIMDASTLLGGTGLLGKAATKVGLISDVGDVAKATSAAGALGAAMDPLKFSLKLAKGTLNLPGSAIRGAAAKTSGLGKEAQQMAFKAGATSNPAMREAFNRFYRGEAGADEYLSTAKSAMDKAKAKASNAYLSKKGALAHGPVDLSTAEKNIRADYHTSSGQGGGWDNLDNAHQDVMDKVNTVLSDPARQSMESVDALKRQINEIRNKYRGNAGALSHVDKAYGHVRDALVSKDAKYAELMEDYQDSLRHLDDARAFLGTGDRASASNSMQRALKKSMTGTGKKMMEDMSKHEPTLPYMLAGAAANPSHGGAMRDIIDAAVSAGLYHVNPFLSILPAIGASPKIVGGANYYLGRAASLPLRAISPAVEAGKRLGTKVPYYGGIAKEETGPSDQAPTADASAPRNIRNNNMGNLVDSKWTQSQPGYVGSDGTFAKFDSPESGHAAADKLLENKGGQGLNTPQSLIKSWAPDAPADYAQKVASALGVNVHDKIDLSSPEVRKVILAVIKRFEGGAAADRYAASGGRIERRAGGKVESKHERLVQRLMMLTRKAKKVEEKRTEPMLNVPDESVVKALGVAQQAI